MASARAQAVWPRRILTIVLVLLLTSLFAAAAAGDAAADASAPVITTVNPAQGARQGGTEVELTGENFTGATDVRFGSNGSASSFTVDSDTSITAVAPPQTAEAYVVGITVEGPGGESAQTPAARFIYGPVVESVGPRQGPGAGGTVVTITGLGLQGASEVDFGASPATDFSVNLDGSITAVAPPFTGGSASVPVSVTTPLGVSNPPIDSTPGVLSHDYFAYGPTVTKVEPQSGPASGGTLVTIHGTGFSSVKGPDEFPFFEAVKFGSAVFSCGSMPRPSTFERCAPSNFQVESETEASLISPAGTGTVDLAVVTTGGISPTAPIDRFSYESPQTAKVSQSVLPGATRTCKKHKVRRHGKCVRKRTRHHHHHSRR